MSKVLAPILIAVALAVAATLTYYLLSDRWAFLERRVADAWMVQSGGPRLARRPVRDDIVMVMFDVATASKLGNVRNHQDDIRVYRKLVDAGVAFVYDARLHASATLDDFEDVKPVLESLHELDQSPVRRPPQPTPAPDAEASRAIGRDSGTTPPPKTTRVVRDIWLSQQVLEQGGDRYISAISQNTVYSRPHAKPADDSRIYPLAYAAQWGLGESAPLTIARHVWGLDPVSPKDVGSELLRCGVFAEWHRAYPDMVAETNEPREDYRLGNHRIAWEPFEVTTPLIPPAGFRIDYAPDLAQLRRISFVDLLQAEDLESLGLGGKIAIIGFSIDTNPSSDSFEIPCGSGKASSVEILAMATQTLLDRSVLQPAPRPFKLGLLTFITFAAIVTGIFSRPLIAIAILLGMLVFYLAVAVGAYRTGWELDFMTLPLMSIVGSLVGITYQAWSSHRTHSQVVDLFGRYVPRAVVNQLMLQSDFEALQIKGTKREITILFADVRGFTRFAEQLSPEKVVQELNSLLEIMVSCTFCYEGTLDKFIGDAILVLFNAPLDQPDHVTRAVSMALELQNRLKQHNSGLSVGIGVHVGEAVVGTIGTPQRMEYTAIGSSVNIASRLCDMAASGTVVVSQAVKEALQDKFTASSLGPIQVKGIVQPISVWKIEEESSDR